VASVGEQPDSIEMRYEDENIWLTQKMMAALYDVSVAAINQHIKKVYDDAELEPNSTIKKFLIVQTEGSRQVSREVVHYSLKMINWILWRNPFGNCYRINICNLGCK
jgi:hypothetical protein